VQRLCLVTGGSAGLGRAIAHGLLAPERTLVIASRNRANCEQVVQELRTRGGRALALELDVSRADSVAAAADHLRALEPAHGPWLELVNNAGSVAVHGAFDPPSDETYGRMLAEHFHGPRRLIAAALPAMRAAGRGAIVNLASAAGLRAFPDTAAYVVAKHALVGYTRAAALELAGSGIGLSAVCPYYVDSPLMERGSEQLAAARGISREEAWAHFGGRNPGGRWVQMDEVAALVAELLATRANGRVVVLDGGPPREALREGEPHAAPRPEPWVRR
jgi:3-hydroxybutyrate dehydrogenase